MKVRFRVVLVSYALSMLAVVAKVLVVGPGEMPEAAAAYLTWWNAQPQTRIESTAGWLAIFAVWFSVFAALGMVFFLPWSRSLFAIAIAVLFISEGFMDYPILKAPFEYQMDTLATLLAGAIIAMSYWSSISERFARTRSVVALD